MRKPRMRLTVRQIMVAVAILAVGLGFAVHARRHQQQAKYHFGMEGSRRATQADFRANEQFRRGQEEQWRFFARNAQTEHEASRWLDLASQEAQRADEYARTAARFAREADQHAALAREHHRAAFRPWRSVPTIE